MKSKVPVGLLIVALLVLVPIACTKAPAPVTPPPTSPPGQQIVDPELPRITPEELKRLMDTGVQLTLVDVRDQATFAKGHIQGAIDIPYAPFPPYTWEMITSLLLALCPQDQLIVLYGD